MDGLGMGVAGMMITSDEMDHSRKFPGNEYQLVGGFNLPLWKMMDWKSVGMMKFPIIPNSIHNPYPLVNVYITMENHHD